MINNSKISEKVTEEVIFLEGLDASFDVNHLLENLYCLRTIIQKDFDISCLNFVSNLYLYIGVTNNKEFENSLNKILAPVFNQIVHDFSNDIIITSFIFKRLSFSIFYFTIFQIIVYFLNILFC